MSDMERSLARAKPSVAPEDLVELEQWTTKYGEEGGLPMYEASGAASTEHSTEQILAMGDARMVALLRECHCTDEMVGGCCVRVVCSQPTFMV